MKEEERKDNLREFDENPYDPENVKPEDIMRIFFVENLPIVPVVSKRGILFGILKKEDVIAELSDIERVNRQKTDQFINKLSRKMTLDDLLPYVANTREFVVINLFGAVQGKWSRIELLEASEHHQPQKNSQKEQEKQKEEQIMEWMIYLILEHIPRALYAINETGKTIFYNSHFEELYNSRMNSDVDTHLVEASLSDPDKNDLIYRQGKPEDLIFHNKEMNFLYEKVPMKGQEKTIGYLIYCDRESNESAPLPLPLSSFKGRPLQEILDTVERLVIVDSIKENESNLKKVSEELGISRSALAKRMTRHGIDYEKKIIGKDEYFS